jgi:DNA-binding MarR family transcriptional regulator
MAAILSILTEMQPTVPLTSRQRRVLEKLIDLYRETREPVHYPLLAQRLGIRNTTAYEMLKLLERAGYVTSEYVLTGNAGPGRSSVVFAPTRQADAAFRLPPSRPERDSEWESVKQQILSRLGHGESAEQDLLEELGSRLSEAADPLVCCAEALTALFLNVSREARQRLQEQEAVLQQFVKGPPALNLLNLLPGLALGLSLSGPARRVSKKLIEYSELCQTYLQQLDDAKQKALADFVRQVLDALSDLARSEGEEHSGAVRVSKD